MSTELVPVSEVRDMAKAAATSGLFPGIKNEQAAFTLMLLCQAEGLHPVQALRRFDIVQGRPAMKADAMLGEFMTRGGKVGWLENTSEACHAEFSAPGLSAPVKVRWTLEDAKRAGLANKAGPWQQYPRQMLRARVISEGIRMSMPGVIAGLYTPEEVQDFPREPNGHAPAPAPVPVQVVEAVPVPVESPPTKPLTPPEDVALATPAQVKALNAALTDMKIKERTAKLAWISREVNREVKSSKDLSLVECSHLIDRAKEIVSPTTEREPGQDDD